MRLPKQIDQIFQLVDQLYNDEPDPVGMAMDECWVDSGDVAGIHKFLLCPGPPFVQMRCLLWYPTSPFFFGQSVILHTRSELCEKIFGSVRNM